ncbi:hypothetical protein K1719_008941 [Acacia pycnantha]|nr:hypothetical protein K1719_008941 [Acacia pycnantha]
MYYAYKNPKSPLKLADLSIGSIVSGGGSAPFEIAMASDWADMVDGFQKSALESRLGIPLIYGIDAVHSNNNIYAKGDANLAQRIWAATPLEVRASGVPYSFAPCVAVCKDPRCGRCYIVSALNAGIDMVMVSFRFQLFLEEFISLVESDTVGWQQHRDLAHESVRKSLVLLKNGKHQSKPFLLLNRKAKRILVAGTHADDLGYQCGDWTISWFGTSGRITIGTMVLDVIKEDEGEAKKQNYL